MHWLTFGWWKHILRRPEERWDWNGNGFQTWLTCVICRIRNHPAGMFWYSSGLEPDTRCRNCGDHLL